MSKREPDPRQEFSDDSDPLSATGMFRRAFEEIAEQGHIQGKAESQEPALPRQPNSSPKTQALPPSSEQSRSGPGEFTQLFQGLDVPPATSGKPVQEGPSNDTSLGKPESGYDFDSPQMPLHDQNPGEFTRIFVKAESIPPPSRARAANEMFRSAPASPSHAKGVSASHASESASTEGSFTRLFKGISSTPAEQALSNSEPAPAIDSQAEGRISADYRGIEPTSAPPRANSPSVTNLIASLSSPVPPKRPAESFPYRPEAPSHISQQSRAQSSAAEASPGVTQLIERLAQAPPSAPAEPIEPPQRAVSSGPGEYTRMISRETPPATPAPSPAIGGPGPKLSTAPPSFGAVAPPPAPKLSPPVPAPVVPPAPKLAPPPVFMAPPKTKLEAMVPILLIINTFLLLVLIVVLIFLVKFH